MLQTFFYSLLRPKSASEDNRRREFILYVLLAGVIVLLAGAFLATMYNELRKGSAFDGVSSSVMFGVLAIFVALYLAARKGYFRAVAYLFVFIIFAATSYALFDRGPHVTQAVLTYSLLVVMAGVLIGSRAAFAAAVVMSIVLATIPRLVEVGIIVIHNEVNDTKTDNVDVIVYGITLLVIALVSWLFNREIEHSLQRARKSEKALEKERNSLEVKVRKRTKEIEKIQMEKMLELNRFAEFGRYTANLLHDLSNPLTAVALNLDQIQDKQKSDAIRRIQNGVEYMEQSVDAARRQLNSKREIREFDTEAEIMRVVGLLESKAKSAQVTVGTQLAKHAAIVGDSSHFDQVVANLIANAIDACQMVQAQTKRAGAVKVSTAIYRGRVELRVKDNGIGISKEGLEHIFEAFYTTKEAGRGTGIGLAIVKTTVETELKGTISVTSTEGSGTEMKVSLPLA